MANKIKLDDDIKTVIVKMADGNPVSIGCLMEFLSGEAERIDPDNLLGGFGFILDLDREGIYGTDIYVFWSDICDKNLSKMMAVLRAVQLGKFSGTVLADACHKQDYSGRKLVPVESLYKQVTEILPNFDLAGRGIFRS